MADRRITASQVVEAMASIWQGVGKKSRAAYTLRAYIAQQDAEIARLREALEEIAYYQGKEGDWMDGEFAKDLARLTLDPESDDGS